METEEFQSARLGTGEGSAEGTSTVLSERDADLVVIDRVQAADGVVSLTLSDPDGGVLPAWTPGAHIDLILPGDLVRQYSLCGNPTDRGTWRIGVLREPTSRGGSSFVHDQLHKGATVRIRGPRNHFPLIGASRYQFVAGGIGITPLLPMIRQAASTGADWSLVYGGRTEDSMAFVDELEQYGDVVELWPQDTNGLLELDRILGTPSPDTLVYCCGPEPLLAAVEARCEAWPAGSLHVERFAPKPQTVEPGGDTAFELVLQRSGVTLEVPADRSILDVIEDEGLSVLSSCCEGICGTCETVVIDGIPDHRDSILSDGERESNEIMMICVSRCLGPRLTLDL